MDPVQDDISAVIRAALREDIGTGDVTSDSIFSSDARIRGSFIAKASGVVAGLDVAGMVFMELDRSCSFSPAVADGSPVGTGSTLATISGPARAVLQGERTALNFLQRMSGIATETRKYVDAVKGTSCTILDTRKTAPGLRTLDKRAVRAGGGQNHRHGLFDMVLIKDNHIDAAGSLVQAVNAVRSGPHPGIPIEVECRTLADVEASVGLGVDRIMLDNMDLDTIRKAVVLAHGAVPLEVSGNVSLRTVRSYAETGVAYVSVGALTHSVAALDISLRIAPETTRN